MGILTTSKRGRRRIVGGILPPDDIFSALDVWWDAQEITGLNDGDPVTDGDWPDLSGNGRYAQQGAAAQQGVFRAAGINGLPSVEFDNLDPNYYFIGPNSDQVADLYDASNPVMTWATVATFDDDTIADCVIALGDTLDDAVEHACRLMGHPTIEWRFFRGDSTDVLKEINGGTYGTGVVVLTIVIGHTGTAGEGELWVDRTKVAGPGDLGFNLSNVNNAAVGAHRTWSDGAGALETQAPHDGDIGEIVMASEAADADQREQLWDYFDDHWGLGI